MDLPVCNTELYLTDNHPKFAKLLKGFCVNVDSVMCILILPDAKCVEVAKKLSKFKDFNEEYANTVVEEKGKVMSLLLNQTITEDYAGGLCSTRARKKVSISPVSKGKFTVTYTGDDGSNSDVKCELLKVMVAPNFDKSAKPFSFAKVLSGYPVVGGPNVERGARLEGSFKGGVVEGIPSTSKSSKIKLACVKQCIEFSKASGKNHFTSAVCGMLKCLQDCGHDDVCKKLCAYIYDNPVATFYTILQPYRGSGQLVPNDFIETWVGAPHYGDYNTVVKDFCDKYCDKSTSEKINEAKNNLSNVMINENLFGMLSSLYSKAFDNPAMKIWADELAFRMSGKSYDDSDELARVNTGEDVSSESLFKDKSYLKTHSDSLEKFIKGNCIMSYCPNVNYEGPEMPPYVKSMIRLNQ